jgi:RNA-directed DNA polymerase
VTSTKQFCISKNAVMDSSSIGIEDLAERLNPIIRGWIQYYGKFNRSAFNKILRYLDVKLLNWVKRKYKKHGKYTKRPKEWLGKVASALPNLFAHWVYVRFPS